MMTTPLDDLTGRTFRYWTVLHRVPGGAKPQWLCRCICGTERVVVGYSMRRKVSPSGSCGCMKGEIVSKYRAEHGEARKSRHGWKSGTYQSWAAMNQRCGDRNHRYWKYYGGCGIKVCARWRKFENFLDDMGPRPPDRSLDRWPDPYGNYEPGNCRWATPKEQRANQRKFKSNRLQTPSPEEPAIVSA